jgi:hypothetical protein
MWNMVTPAGNKPRQSLSKSAHFLIRPTNPTIVKTDVFGVPLASKYAVNIAR